MFPTHKSSLYNHPCLWSLGNGWCSLATTANDGNHVVRPAFHRGTLAGLMREQYPGSLHFSYETSPSGKLHLLWEEALEWLVTWWSPWELWRTQRHSGPAGGDMLDLILRKLCGKAMLLLSLTKIQSEQLPVRYLCVHRYPAYQKRLIMGAQ